jgi:hypothetical protein
MVRDMRSEDIETVKDIYKAQGFDYSIPDLTSPLILVKKVREVDGRVVAACLLRITAETFLITMGSPVEKGRAIEELQPEVLREAYEKGLSEIVCVIPPEISEFFAPALVRMGWQRTKEWPMYQRDLT